MDSIIQNTNIYTIEYINKDGEQVIDFIIETSLEKAINRFRENVQYVAIKNIKTLDENINLITMYAKE